MPGGGHVVAAGEAHHAGEPAHKIKGACATTGGAAMGEAGWVPGG